MPHRRNVGGWDFKNCRFKLFTAQINVWRIIVNIQSSIYGILPLDILSHHSTS